MFRLRRLLICHPLRSTYFDTLHCYYEMIRLLTARRPRSVYKTLLSVTACHSGDCQTSQVRLNYLCMLATLLDPGGTCTSSRYRSAHCCLWCRRTPRLPLYILTGLNRFTLSHCGSHAPLPTLKPGLAASVPRLCTGCSLRFTGSGLSPNYISSAELAHLLSHSINLSSTGSLSSESPFLSHK